MNDQRHFREIDTLRGMAIFLVVLGHSIIVYPINLHENIVCNFIFRWLSSVHMPLFFVLSGFCFSYKGCYKDFIIKKIKRLMIPYCFMGMIEMLIKLLLSGFVNQKVESIRSYIYDLTVLGDGYWFLYTLFMIFFLYPFFYRIIKGSIGKHIMFIAATIVLYYVFPSITVLAFSKTLKYLSYFDIGVLVREFLSNKVFDVSVSKRKVRIMMIGLLAIWSLLIYLDMEYTEMAEAFLGIFTLYLCLQFERINKIFERFGKYSLQLYLLNGYMLGVSRTIIVNLIGITNPVIIIVFNMIVDFGISYILIKYICSRVKVFRFTLGMI